MSTFSVVTFLDCQPTSEMYCLALGGCFWLMFSFKHSNEVLGYPRLNSFIILVLGLRGEELVLLLKFAFLNIICS